MVIPLITNNDTLFSSLQRPWWVLMTMQNRTYMLTRKKVDKCKRPQWWSWKRIQRHYMPTLHRVFVTPLAPGVQLVVIFNCCHCRFDHNVTSPYPLNSWNRDWATFHLSIQRGWAWFVTRSCYAAVFIYNCFAVQLDSSTTSSIAFASLKLSSKADSPWQRLTMQSNRLQAHIFSFMGWRIAISWYGKALVRRNSWKNWNTERRDVWMFSGEK